MRRVLTPAHATFSAANRTISFATTVPASISHILKVTNLTRAEVLFDPTAESGLGYLSSATYASPVLTLAVNTAGMADNDRLFIEYDDGLGGGGGGASGEVTVLGSVEISNDTGNPVPVATGVAFGSGAVNATTQRVTLASDGPGVAALTNIDNKTPALVDGRQPVEVLGIPGVARQLAAGASSANTALTSTCRRISIRAVGADIRYAIGSSSQTANAATSHLIGIGERLDVAVPATPNIAVIRAGATSGTLELTELI